MHLKKRCIAMASRRYSTATRGRNTPAMRSPMCSKRMKFALVWMARVHGVTMYSLRNYGVA